MLFDPLLRAGALSARDLADLRFFGVGGALLPADDAALGAGAAAVRKGWEALLARVSVMRRAGLAGYAALGLPPTRIPLRGLEALLAGLPDLLGRAGAAAVGALGLDRGGELEERVLLRQLELARELRRPVVILLPPRGRPSLPAPERLLPRILALLEEAAVEPGRVLVAGADVRTMRPIRARGYAVALALTSADGSPRDAIDAAVAAVRASGPEGIALCSDAGLSGGDLLALPRAADRLAAAGLGPAVIRRVCGENAIRLLGVEPRAHARGLPAASGRSGPRASRRAR